MRRPRKFLFFILILLIINTLFFLAWYALDLQGVVKGIVEKEAGKALNGKLQFKSFSISDQQVFAEGITFQATDGSLSFKVESARVRFNLLKFLFSGFKMRNILNHVEINKADIVFNNFAKPKTKGPPKKFEIPDLRTLFNDLKVTDSSFKLNLNIPLVIGEAGILSISEKFYGININVKNTRVSTVDLRAVSSRKGKLELTGILDKGRLVSSHIEIANYVPGYINHPNLQNASTELNLVLDASQKEKNATLDIDAKAILWNTEALLLTKYPINIPLLTVESDGNKLVADIAQSTVGTSSLGGSIALTGLQKEIIFQPSRIDMVLDLNMLLPELQGEIDASLSAEGKVSDPTFTLTAGSSKLSYLENTLEDISLQASYADKELTLALDNAVWQNQKISIDGIFNTEERQLIGILETSPVSLAQNEMKINATADIEINLYTILPEVKANFNYIDFALGDLNLQAITGYLNLFPSQQGETQNYYVDMELDANNGTHVSVVGDILDRNILLDASFESLALTEVYPLPLFLQFEPVISGQLSSFLTGSKLVVSTNLDLGVASGVDLYSKLDLTGSYDLETQEGMAVLGSSDASLNSEPFALELISEIAGTKLNLRALNLNEKLFLSGTVDLQNLADLAFEMNLKDMSSADIVSYFPGLNLPDISGVNFTAGYNMDGADIVNADFSMQEFVVPGIRPLSAEINIQGHPSQLEIVGGIDNQTRRLIDINGTADLLNGPDLRIRALAQKLSASDIMFSALADGDVECDVGLYLNDILSSSVDFSFDAQVLSTGISIPDAVDLDDIFVKISQTRELLTVDTLSVKAGTLASVDCSGALDYNLLTNTYYEGNHTLDINIVGLLFDWLAKQVDYITSASGKSDLHCKLRTNEDQFLVESGELNISEGRMALKDQPEKIRNIDIKAVFEENKVLLSNFTCQMGEGVLTVQNAFDADPDSHLNIGFLDLGTLSLKIDQPGALVNIPMVTTPHSRSNVVLRGQNSDFATVTGPFDDMHISAEALIYNSSAVFPPDTDNLLNLIYSFRGVFTKPEPIIADPVPLPFTLDLMVRLMDNVKYTTYPANLVMKNDGFFHIIYDGDKWIAKEASFISEQGSLDFFGTVFQTESVALSIIESQNLVDIQGSFYRRAADGTIITLTVSTDKDTSKPILERLSFALKSDNPDDRTISNILARLRYNASTDELSATQQGSLLQDEALNLISDNLNSSLVSPFLYPLENTIRRLLKLDDFSIHAGFIQNLFTTYSNDPNQLSEFTDMDQFANDIAQFSSSILLNNLSISMSKYLGRKFFLDYTLTLQESTDLLNKTQILVSHDTSLRWFLPEQFRLAYTFKYEPKNAKMAHEIMLQRSIRFWGF